MKKNIKNSFYNFKNLINQTHLQKFTQLFLLLLGLFLLPLYQGKSEEIFLKCIGKYEINRGPLIKPDWETNYLKVNLSGLFSTVDNKSGIKKGRTSIRGNSYKITQRDNRYRIKNIYKINRTYGTYIFESSQKDRILVGTCQKSRG